MVGLINHPLRKIADRIVSRVKPTAEQDDTRRLLYSAILFIKRVETNDLTQKEKAYNSHPKLQFLKLAISTEIADSLRDRIRILEEYRIRSMSRIQEMLLYGLERTSHRTLTRDEVAILNILAREPMISISRLATRVKKSRYVATNAIKKLENDIGLRRLYSENRGKLKLTTFSLVFRTRSFEASQKFESWIQQTQPPFMTALVFDVSYRYGFITYAIPTQQRAHRLFEDRVQYFKRAFMDQVHLHQVLDMYWNIRFDLYDHTVGQWQIPSELENLSKIPKYDEKSFSTISYCNYADLQSPVPFSRSDFLLANMAIGPRHTLADLQEFLANYGWHLSKNAIWVHLNRLKKEAIISPMLYFSGAGFEEFICLSIYCEPDVKKQLQLLASLFPAAFTYVTKQGIAIFLKRPTGWRGFIHKLIRDIPEIFEIKNLLVIHQERNLGSGLQQNLYERWNEKRQYWEFFDEEI
ncbi:MAG: MarR family transcriptional regulator [Candidatus Hermodarchaeota archaeon]